MPCQLWCTVISLITYLHHNMTTKNTIAKPPTAQESDIVDMLEELYEPDYDYTREHIREKELDFHEA